METRVYYVCGTTWKDEIGHTSVTFYKSIEALKRKEGCWKECGIYKLELQGIKILEAEVKDEA